MGAGLGSIVGSAAFRLTMDKGAFAFGMRDAQSEAQSGVAGISNAFHGLGRVSSQAGIALSAGLTLPLAALGKSVFEVGSNFESAFAGVQKTVDATAEEFAVIRQEIRDMAKEIPTTREEIASIAEAAGQLGIQTESITAFTKVIAAMGVATNLTTHEAAISLARLANIMQTSEADFERLGSTVVDLGNNFAAMEDEIIRMALRIGGAGKVVGLTEADILGFATAMASLGVRVEAGGTAISRVFITMANAAEIGGEKLEGFGRVAGLSGEQFAKVFREDASEAVLLFIEGLRKMSDEGEGVFTTLKSLELGEIRVRDALLRMAAGGDLVRESLERGNQSWRENTALAEEAARRYETVESRLQMLRNRFTDLFVTVFDALREPLVGAIDWAAGIADSLERLVEWFARLSPEMQKTIVVAGALVAAIGPMALIFGGMVLAISTLLNPIGALVIALGSLGVAAGVVAVNWEDFSAKFPDASQDIENLGKDIAAFAITVVENMDLVGTIFFGFIKLIAAWSEVTVASINNVDAHLRAFFDAFQWDGDAFIPHPQFNVSQMQDDANAATEEFERITQHYALQAGQAWTEIEAAWEKGHSEFHENRRKLDQKTINEMQRELFGSAHIDSQRAGPFGGYNFEQFSTQFDNQILDNTRSLEAAKDAAIEFAEANGQATQGLVRDLENAISKTHVFELVFSAVVQGIIKDGGIMNDTLREAFGAIGFFEGTPSEMAAEFDDLGGSMEETASAADNMARAAGNLATLVSSASDAITHWQGLQDQGEQALDILKRQIEEQGYVTAEQERQLGILTWGVERAAGAITNDLEPAFVDAVTAQFGFIKAADDLKAALDADDISLEEYEEGIRNLALATDPAIAITEGLVDTMDDTANIISDVVGRIEEILVALGLIPEDPRLDIYSNAGEVAGDVAGMGDEWAEFNEAPDKSLVVKHNLPDVEHDVDEFTDNMNNAINEPLVVDIDGDSTDADKTFDEIKTQAQIIEEANPMVWFRTENDEETKSIMDEVIRKAVAIGETEPTVVVDADTAASLEQVTELGIRTRELADGNYLVTINANITPIELAVQKVRDLLPSSPAKEGPLAFTPTWDWVFERLPAVAQFWTDETKTVLQDYINSIASTGDWLNDEFLNQFPLYARESVAAMGREFARLSGMEDIHADVLDLSFLSDPDRVASDFDSPQAAMTEAAEAGDEEAKQTTARAQDWKDEAAKAVTLVESALGLLESLGKAAVEITPEIETKIASLTLLAGMATNHMREAAIAAGPMPEHGEEFLTFAKGSLDTMNSALTLLNGLSESVADFTHHRFEEEIAALKFVIEKAVVSLRETSAVLGTDGLEEMNSFLESAKLSVELMTSALTLLEGLSESTANFTRFHFEEHIATLKFLIEKAVVSLRDTSNAIGEMPPELNSFLESATLSMTLLIEALNLLNGLTESAGNFTRFHFEEHIASLKFLIEKAVVSLADTAQVMRDGYAPELIEFNEAALGAVEVMLATLELLEALTATSFDFNNISTDLTNNIQQLAIMAYLVAALTSNVADTWDGDVNPNLELFSEAVSNSVGALGDTLGFLEALTDTAVNLENISRTLLRDISALAGIGYVAATVFGGTAATWDDSVNEQIELFAKAVGDSVGALGNVFSFLQALSDGASVAIPNAESLRGIGQKLSDAGRVFADEMKTAGEDWDVEVNPGLEAFATAVSASVGALGDVLSLLGMFQQESDKVTTQIDDEGKRSQTIVHGTYVNHLQDAGRAKQIGETLAAAGLAIADAVLAAMDAWVGTDDESVQSRLQQFSDAVELSVGGATTVFDLLSKISEEKLPIRSLTGGAFGLINAGLEISLAFADAGQQITPSAQESAAAFYTWSQNIFSSLNMISEINDKMPSILEDAISYHDFCARITQEIMAGNQELSKVGMGSIDLSFASGSIGPLSAGVSMSNASMAAPQTGAKTIVIQNEIGGERVDTYILDTVTGVLEKMF